MKSYDEIVDQVVEATAQHRRRVKRIQQITSASVMCAVCVLGLSVYLNLEPQQTLPTPSETQVQTTSPTQISSLPEETMSTNASDEAHPSSTLLPQIPTNAPVQTEQSSSETRRPVESSLGTISSSVGTIVTQIQTDPPEVITVPPETSVIVMPTDPPESHNTTPSIPDFNQTNPNDPSTDPPSPDGNEPEPPAMETPPEFTDDPTNDSTAQEPTGEPTPFTTTTTTSTTTTCTVTITTTLTQVPVMKRSATANSRWLYWTYGNISDWLE